nr:Chain B, LP2 [Homo sapiens]
EFPDFP